MFINMEEGGRVNGPQPEFFSRRSPVTLTLRLEHSKASWDIQWNYEQIRIKTSLWSTGLTTRTFSLPCPYLFSVF